jgi:hypothetical protein
MLTGVVATAVLVSKNEPGDELPPEVDNAGGPDRAVVVWAMRPQEQSGKYSQPVGVVDCV